MLATCAFLVVMAAAKPAESPPPRTEIFQGVAEAQKLVGDFEEAKALEVLDKLAARADLTPSEVALVQLNRGVVLAGQMNNDEAGKAFALARGCDKKLKAPKVLSPKAKQVFNKAKPAACPASAPAAAPSGEGGMEFDLDETTAATAPAPAPAPEPAPAPAPEPDKPVEQFIEAPSDAPAKPVENAPVVVEKDAGGPPVMAIAGGGVLALGALFLVGGLVSLVGAGVLVGGSFPVFASAQASERARDARQMASAAFGMRIGSIGLVGAAALAGLIALIGVGAGAVVLVLGLR